MRKKKYCFRINMNNVLPKLQAGQTFPCKAKLVLNAYSVFPPPDHFDVHAVFYLIVDIHFFATLCGPSQLILRQHLYTSNTAFISSFWLNQFQPPICVLVLCVSVKGEQAACEAIFSQCNSFEGNSSLLSRCDKLDCFPFSETFSKFIFECHHICTVALTVIDFIHGCGVIKNSIPLQT